MVNLAKSIGRIISSYKEIQNLAGYTLVVDELRVVLDDVINQKFVRPQVNAEKLKQYVGGKVSN